MRTGALVTLVRRDLARSRGALGTAGFGIAAGTAALVFFLALGLAVRAVLLGEVFPLDRVELEPAAKPEPGLLAMMMGGAKSPPGIPQAALDRVAKAPGVVGVFPKLRFAFPSGAFGGKEIIGYDVGTHEMLADGIDPALVAKDVTGDAKFEDPLQTPGNPCTTDDQCKSPKYCELPAGEAGQCSDPVPVVVSPYLVEIFNKGIAPAHGLPQIGRSLLERAQGITFRLELGVSMMGKANKGVPRSARARVVGIAANAIDLGITLPLPVVRRWNREFFGPDAADKYSSAVFRVRDASNVADVIAAGAAEGLVAKDTHARDVSVMVSGVIGLLSLVAGVLLTVAASNIAYTFRVLIAERRAEIGLYRALGATPSDIGAWVIALSLVVGVVGGAVGVLVARVASIFIDLAAASHLPDFPFKPQSFFLFPTWLLFGGALFGALFSLLGALTAARGAARLDPSRALTES